MATFHFSAQQISRGAGRSAVAAAAYRACEKLTDARTGLVHDFGKKRGRDLAQVFLPGGGTMNRNELWNAVEKKHKRGDAIVAREFEVSLPHELNKEQRDELVREYCQDIADTYKIAVDVGVHAPIHGAHKDHSPNHHEQDPRNFHAHIMTSACYVSIDGVMGKKCVEMDPIHCKRAKIENAVEVQRKRWQFLCNRALEKAGRSERIDHRSHAERGIMVAPGQHHGPAVSGLIARGESSDVANRQKEQNYVKTPDLDDWIEAARIDVEAAEQELIGAQAEHDAKIQAQAKAQAAFKATKQALAQAATQAQAKAAAQAQAEAQAVAQAQAEAQAAAQAQALAQAQAEAQAAAQAQALAQAQAEAQAAAQAQALAQAQAEAQAAAQAHAKALAKAWIDHKSAEESLADAVRDQSTARARADRLRPAHDEAVDGQRQAGQGFLETAKALTKIAGWTRAIDAYESAVAALRAAAEVVNKARQALTQAWSNLIRLDPSIREREQAARAAAQAAQIEAQRVEKERQQQIKAANKARLRELERPSGWKPEKPLSEHSREPQRDRGGPERGG